MTLVKIMKGSTFPYPSRGKNNTLSIHKTINEKKYQSVLKCGKYNKSKKSNMVLVDEKHTLLHPKMI
jgi:hypothetical protein